MIERSYYWNRFGVRKHCQVRVFFSWRSFVSDVWSYLRGRAFWHQHFPFDFRFRTTPHFQDRCYCPDGSQTDIRVEFFTFVFWLWWSRDWTPKPCHVTDQSEPKPSTGDIWQLVIADMEARRLVGIERYGTPLQANNGRKALVDAYQEALDLVVYLRQELEEREQMERLIRILKEQNMGHKERIAAQSELLSTKAEKQS